MEILKYILLGFGIGGGYALAAQGLVLIYRGSGVINLAQGAILGAGAFVYWELTDQVGLAPIPAVLAVTLAGGLVGLVIHVAVMRPLRRATGVMRLIATTGVMTIISQALVIRYTESIKLMEPLFPRVPVDFGGGLVISEDRLWMLGAALVLSAGLTVLYRFSRFGVATTALSERERVVAAQGWNPGLLAALNWFVGCALAGLAGGLLGPVVQFTPSSATLLIVPVLAAALLGGFKSFPIAFLGGVGIGVGQSLMTRYVTTPGWGDALPFLVVVAILVLRGAPLPTRSHIFERLPKVGDPRLRVRTVIVIAVISLVLVQQFTGIWVLAASTTFSVAIIALSVVVVTGYAGQLSFAQFALAGVGALVASRMGAAWGVSFWVGLVGAVLVAIPVGAALGLPALRTRGVNLAIATLALALAVERIVLSNADYTGGLNGTIVKPPTLFGYSLDPTTHPDRYATLCLVAFFLCAIAVTNLRRGPGGRRLIAVRSNERAAAAMGINVTLTKLYGFELGAVLAAIGGAFIAFRNPTVLFGGFTALAGISIVAFCVIGGIGYATSSFTGALLASGAFGAVFLSTQVNLGQWVLFIGGIGLLITVVLNPDGTIPAMLQRVKHKPRKLPDFIAAPPDLSVDPKSLSVRGLGVSLGGIRAVHEVSFDVQPGEIVGLIGPNGAGKTTCLDLITGFTKGNGEVVLGDHRIDGLTPARRARRGLGRSFQSLELFEDVTVWDNLATASETTAPRRYGLDLVFPRRALLSPAAAAAVEAFELREHLGQYPSDLSIGTRRIVAIARAVATAPSVLLLDEPAAGLDDTESAELGALLQRIAKQWNLGVVLIEHDMTLVMRTCDRVVVLDEGMKIAEGTPAEVAADPAVISAYLGDVSSEAASPVEAAVV